MVPARAHQSLRPLAVPQYTFSDFNICRLMAEKAMHDQDYRTQLERSAHGHGKPIELSEANGEIMTSMAALRQKYINDVNKSLRKLRRRASKVDESRNMVAHSQVTDMNGEGSIAEVRKTKVRDTDNACWASEGVGFTITGTVSSNARRALTILAANERIQADSHPFQLMKLPAELRAQIYREILIGGGRAIVVFAGSEFSMWSRSCRMERSNGYGKDITTALLRTSRRIYDEALPVLYQSHTFDFGIDVHNIAPFFDHTSLAARQNVHCIHMELLRYGTDRPLRSVPGRDTNDSCLKWSYACAYIASYLRVKEISFNINFTIHQDFQRFHWVKDLAQMRGVRAVFHHNSPNEHGLKSTEASILLANQISRHNWGTDEYRWETLLEYLKSKICVT